MDETARAVRTAIQARITDLVEAVVDIERDAEWAWSASAYLDDLKSRIAGLREALQIVDREIRYAEGGFPK